MHPSTGITKEYSVTLDRKPRQEELQAMASGCDMGGAFVQPLAIIRDDSDAAKNTRIRVVVAEGRNREVGGLGRGTGRTGEGRAAAWGGVGGPGAGAQ